MVSAKQNSQSSTNRKVTAILQGRLGSNRLPGKVLLPLQGKPVMQHVFERILYCQRIDRVIVATTDLEQDDPIVELFNSLDVQIFRGSSEDPTDRYYRAAQHFRVKHLVRIMADCPLVDPKIVDKVIDLYFNGDHDFCCLAGEFPTGLDTTVYSFKALKKVWQETTRKSDREHISPYIMDNPDLFSIGRYKGIRGLYNHRWVMDHPQDYEFVTAVYKGVYCSDNPFNWRDVVKFLNTRPDVLKLNQGIPRDEGYQRMRSAETLEPSE